MSEDETDREAELVRKAQENPDDVPPGVYTEERDDGYHITVVPERPAQENEDPRDVPGQRRIDDGWRRGDDIDE